MWKNVLISYVLATRSGYFWVFHPKEDLKKGRLRTCNCKSIHNLAQSAVLLLVLLGNSKVFWIAGVQHSQSTSLAFLMFALIMQCLANYMTKCLTQLQSINVLDTCGHDAYLCFQWKIRHRYSKENEQARLLEPAWIIFYEVSSCYSISSTTISISHKASSG